jgi:hypothetical protein
VVGLSSSATSFLPSLADIKYQVHTDSHLDAPKSVSVLYNANNFMKLSNLVDGTDEAVHFSPRLRWMLSSIVDTRPQFQTDMTAWTESLAEYASVLRLTHLRKEWRRGG